MDKMIIYQKKYDPKYKFNKGFNIFSRNYARTYESWHKSREKSYKIVQTYAKRCFSENKNLFDLISNDKYYEYY